MNWKQGGGEGRGGFTKIAATFGSFAPEKDGRLYLHTKKRPAFPRLGTPALVGIPPARAERWRFFLWSRSLALALTELDRDFSSAGHKHQDCDLFTRKSRPLAKSGTEEVADTSIFRIYMYMDKLGQEPRQIGVSFGGQYLLCCDL